MCIPGLDPVTLALMAASTAATVGGGMIQRNEQQQNDLRSQQAQNKVLSDYLKQQDAYEKANREKLGDTLATYTPEEQAATIDTKAQERTAEAAANAPDATALTSTAATASAPKVVRDAFERGMGGAAADSAAQTGARSRMSAYGDSWLENIFANQDAARDIGMRNAFSRQDTALLPYQQQWMDVLARKPSSGIGETLQGVGALGSLFAGAGAPGLVASGPSLGGVMSATPYTAGALYSMSPVTGRWGGPV